MKKNLLNLAAFLTAVALLVSFASCDDGNGTEKPPADTSYAITIGTYPNGSIAGPATAKAKEEVTLTIHPDAGYKLANIGIANVTLNGSGDGSGATRTFTMPANAVTVTASFEALPAGTYTVNIQGNNNSQGTVTASPTSGTADTEITLTIVLEDGYEVNQITATSGGADVPISGSGLTRTFSMPAGNVTVFASFKLESSATTYTVNITGNGSQGTVTANPNGGEESTPITLTIAAAQNYELDTITATSGGSPFILNGSGLTRTFDMPAANVSVTVTWKASEGTTEDNIVYGIYSGALGTDVRINAWEQASSSSLNTITGRSGGFAASYTAPASGWGGGFDFLIDEGIDFDTVDALSFWVKSPDSGVVVECGFAGDGAKDWEVLYTGEDNTGLVVTDQWQHVIVPLPNHKNVNNKQAFFILGRADFLGKTVHVDDVALITADSSIKSITLAQYDEAIAKNPGVTPFNSFLAGMKVVYTVDSKDVTLFNGHVAFTNYFDTIEWTVGGDAGKSGDNSGVLPTAGGTTFTLAATFGGKTSNTLNGTISSSLFLYLDDFAGLAGDVGDYGAVGYWASSWWAGFGPRGGRDAVAFIGSNWDYAAVGRKDQAWDLSPFTTITISFYAVEEGNDAPSLNEDHRFGLDFGPDASHTEFYSPTLFQTDTANVWKTVTITLADLETAGGVKITAQQLEGITGWRIDRRDNIATGNVIAIGYIRADE